MLFTLMLNPPCPTQPLSTELNNPQLGAEPVQASLVELVAGWQVVPQLRQHLGCRTRGQEWEGGEGACTEQSSGTKDGAT